MIKLVSILLLCTTDVRSRHMSHIQGDFISLFTLFLCLNCVQIRIFLNRLDYIFK